MLNLTPRLTTDETTIKKEFSDFEIIEYKLPDIVDILIKSGKLESFKNNPQKFIDICVNIIKKTMSLFIVVCEVLIARIQNNHSIILP